MNILLPNVHAKFSLTYLLLLRVFHRSQCKFDACLLCAAIKIM